MDGSGKRVDRSGVPIDLTQASGVRGADLQQITRPKNLHVASAAEGNPTPALATITLQAQVRSSGANRDAKTEILKAINTDPMPISTLREFAEKGPQHRAVLASALGSAMEGAGWIRKAVGGDAVALAKNAMEAFVHLSRSEALPEATRQGVITKLGGDKSHSGAPTLPSSNSPFWAAARQLPPGQRIQLADCLSPLPLKVYDQSSECLQLRSQLGPLERKLGELLVDGSLGPLYRICLRLKIDLLENGVQVPSSADISRAAGVHSADVVARFEEKLAEPKVLTALKEAQDFWAKNGDSIDALKERIATLKNELQPYVNEGRPDLIDAGFRMPQQELALRRDIFAGKPGATHENCLASVDNADLMPSYL